MQSSNQFLNTRVLATAAQQARTSYLETLYRVQGHPWTPNLAAWLGTEKQNHEDRVTAWFDTALSLAYAGQVQAAGEQLASVIVFWGLYRAYADLLDVGRHLDPTSPDVSADMARATQHELVHRANLLLSEMQRGEEDWAAEQQRRAADWQQVASVQVHQMLGQQTQWHDKALVQHQQMVSSWQQATEMNTRYANTALDAVKQAQEGVRNQYSYSVQVMAGAAEMQKAYTQHMQQTLPRQMEQAAERVERRRFIRRGMWVLILVLSVPVAFLFAFVLLQLALPH